MRKMNLPKCDERIEKMCMRKMSLPRCDERKDKKKILHHWFGSEWNVSV